MRDILIRARELIADEDHWLQSVYSNGPLADPTTNCFCLVGAVNRATLEKLGLENFEDMDENVVICEAERSNTALNRLQSLLSDDIPEFNDSPDTTHADVLELLDAAIAQ
jgi:hypothetical protein